MSQLFRRIDTVFIEVIDIEYSIKWYTEVLGFSLRWYDKDDGYAAINVSETPITLVQAEEVKPAKHSPFNFYTSDIKLAHDYLKKNGVTVGEIEAYGEKVLSFIFNDPDGNKLGVCYFEE